MVTAYMIRHSGERRNPVITISYWIPAFGLVDKPHILLCRVFSPRQRDDDLTPKFMLVKGGWSHEFTKATSQDQPQLLKVTFSTGPFAGKTGQLYFEHFRSSVNKTFGAGELT